MLPKGMPIGHLFKKQVIMKYITTCILSILLSGICLAGNKVFVEIKCVQKSGGIVYISLFNSENAYNKKEVYLSKYIDPKESQVIVELELPFGLYLVSAYQDLNSNKKLDTNILGIPKEPVGISNYDGKGTPGKFDKHKVVVDQETKKITVTLHKL